VPQNNKEKTKTDFAEKIWNFFTSLKLVIFLLLILSALSVAGTIIEQNKPLPEYYRVFQPETVALFSKLGLLDMYHSWWFISCLALLAMNIIACTMDRYAPIMAGLRKKNLILDETLQKTLNPLERIKYSLPLEAVEQRVLQLTAKSFAGKPIVTQAEDGSRHYFLEKGKYSRLAFFFTHLSLLLIFIGAVTGSFFGFKGYINVFEGETISRLETRSGDMKSLDFTIRCNSFQADFYPSGAPKDYRSDLSVLKDGKEVLRKVIRVNDPLSFQGVTFYQSSYGTLPDEVQLEVLNPDGSLRGVVAAAARQKVALPGLQDQVEVAEYNEHFHLPDGSEGGAAVGVNLYPEKGEPSGLWLLQKYPDYDRMRKGAYYFKVRDLKLRKYTGLQVNRDPGEGAVWAGSLLLIAGVMVAFFISHKKLWICFKKDKKGRVDVTIGGTANKNRSSFVRETEGIIQSLKEDALLKS
jgi:cytochrome c biogenesis protein